MKPFAATNEPNTCYWCGQRTREALWGFPHFDSLACAANFGKLMAESGKKLQPAPRVQPKVAP